MLGSAGIAVVLVWLLCWHSCHAGIAAVLVCNAAIAAMLTLHSQLSGSCQVDVNL